MLTIQNAVEHEIVINKSRFIAVLTFVKSLDSIKEALSNIKKQYKNVNHYCYAYVVNDIKKSSDDGEPGGTAGIPIMEILSKNSLNYCLCVVVRYFGGIKLGVGGLARAYMKVTNEAIRQATIMNIIDGFKIYLNIGYNEREKFERIIQNSNVIYEYGDVIKCIVSCKEDIKERLSSCFTFISIEKEEIFEEKKISTDIFLLYPR